MSQFFAISAIPANVLPIPAFPGYPYVFSGIGSASGFFQPTPLEQFELLVATASSLGFGSGFFITLLLLSPLTLAGSTFFSLPTLL
jgi:hypothetical protein